MGVRAQAISMKYWAGFSYHLSRARLRPRRVEMPETDEPPAERTRKLTYTLTSKHAAGEPLLKLSQISCARFPQIGKNSLETLLTDSGFLQAHVYE
jgi:hypothetical protein